MDNVQNCDRQLPKSFIHETQFIKHKIINIQYRYFISCKRFFLYEIIIYTMLKLNDDFPYL
jgi:hypothetical protein